MKQITVLLADDHMIVRQGLLALLKAESDITVVGEADNGQLIAEGRANKQVARELGISVKTVEKHRQHLMKKLDQHDTSGLTRYAIAAGIIESSVQVTIL